MGVREREMKADRAWCTSGLSSPPHPPAVGKGSSRSARSSSHSRAPPGSPLGVHKLSRPSTVLGKGPAGERKPGTTM